MMEQRNLIMAIVMSVSILLGWQILIEAPRVEQERAKIDAQKTGKSTETAATAPNGSAIQAPPRNTSGNSSNAVAPVAGQPARPAAVSRENILGAVPRVKIQTNRLVGSIRLDGALIDDLTLLDYRQSLDKNSKNIILLSPQGTKEPYFTWFGWAAITPNISVPDTSTKWKSDKEILSVGSPVTLRWTSPENIEFTQTLSIDKDFMFSVRQTVTNNSQQLAEIHPFGLVSMTGTPETSGFWILHEGPIGAFDGKLTELDYDDIEDEDRGIKTQKSTGGWIGITAKYFATTLVPDQKSLNTSRFVHTAPNGQNKYQVDYLAAAQSINPGTSSEFNARLFAGAKEVRVLDAYRDELNLPIFDKLVDFGWFYYLTKPIFYALEYFHRILGNFGLAILLLTVLIKIAFFPLANKSYRSMSRLKKLQPKMVEIRERYKDDRQRQNQAMMELYKKEGANPMSGCFPILIQIPVFFALYKVLFVAIEMRHAPFFGWIQDLSAPDPLGILIGFGLFEWNVPPMLAVANIGIWPIIMGITMYLQQKLNPQPADPMQQKIFMVLPIVFTFLLGGFPAGLVIYWAWNNLLSIAQQWVIMRKMGVSASGAAINPGQPKPPPRGNRKTKQAPAGADSEENPSRTSGANKGKAQTKNKGKTRRRRKRR